MLLCSKPSSLELECLSTTVATALGWRPESAEWREGSDRLAWLSSELGRSWAAESARCGGRLVDARGRASRLTPRVEWHVAQLEVRLFVADFFCGSSYLAVRFAQLGVAPYVQAVTVHAAVTHPYGPAFTWNRAPGAQDHR
jgi:hypothetical protein